MCNLIHGSLGPLESTGVSIGSAIFASLTVKTNLSDLHTVYSVAR